MKKVLLVLMVLSLIAIYNGVAEAVVITFSDLEVPGTTHGTISSYSNSGYQFTAPSNFIYWQQSSTHYNTSAALGNASGGKLTTLSRTEEALFCLLSIDVDTFYKEDKAQTITFTAYNADSSVAGTESISIEADGWNTLTFGDDFRNIAYVQWPQAHGGHHFDNVEVLNECPKPIPEPASLLLLGLGSLGVLVGLRKKI